MNQYIKLDRVEFVITKACSSRCKHCSWGECPSSGSGITADAAISAIKRLTERFDIKSVMTFGGEPLLFADTVAKIHATARDCGISERSLITNGYFSRDERKINEVAKALCDSGVNDVLLSVDAFHQEFIPIDPVIQFAEALLLHGIPNFRVHPAWVVNEANDNPYNTETRRLLKIFTDKGIRASGGNDIFPSGNALKYLAEYYPPSGEVDLSVQCGSAPYTSRPDEIDCLNITPDGEIHACSAIGNIYDDDVLGIIDRYDPYDIPALRAVLDGGVAGLLSYAEPKLANINKMLR